MKWIECIKSIATTGESGPCSLCKSKNTDYRCVTLDDKNKIGFLDVWCNGCKSLGHLSRVRIDENKYKTIPLDKFESVVPKYKVIN